MNMDEQQLPPGWELAPLFDICSPKQWPTLATSELSSDGYPVYGANGKIGFHTAYNHEHPTILITCRGATCGTLNVCEAKSWVNGNAMALDDLRTDAADFSYTLFALRNRGFSDVVSGSAQPQITRAGLEPVQIPLAPLPEQRRIVTKIEALQERSGRAAKALEEVGPLLEQFRQSILAAAFSGRLTADWREKNPDAPSVNSLMATVRLRKAEWYADECAKAIREGRSKPSNPANTKKSDKEVIPLPTIPDTWQYVRLEDLSYLIVDGTHYTPNYTSEGIPFLSVKNVRPMRLLTSDVKFISHGDFEKTAERFRPGVGDILYTKVGATFGYAVRNTLEYPFSIYVSLALIKPVAPDFDSEYAELVMNSSVIFAQARDRVSGSGVPDLHLIEIRDFRVPVPPVAEQQEIVRRLKELFTRIRPIEAEFQNATKDLTVLNQSILAKAFRGELVPQDPNDEPASELLARIRREREFSGDRAQGSGRKKNRRKGTASESARPAKRSKRTSKVASATTPDASTDASPEPSRPQRRRRRSSSNNEDASLVIRVLAEGGCANIHADTSGPVVQFYTKSSGGGLLAELEDIPESALQPRESQRVATLRDIMEPDLALLYPKDVNETYLPQLRDWYTWAAPQLPEHFESKFLEQAKSRWLEALEISAVSGTAAAALRRSDGRLFDS